MRALPCILWAVHAACSSAPPPKGPPPEYEPATVGTWDAGSSVGGAEVDPFASAAVGDWVEAEPTSSGGGGGASAVIPRQDVAPPGSGGAAGSAGEGGVDSRTLGTPCLRWDWPCGR